MSNIQRKERPILFSGPMVRAILEGRKTVTRRVVKPVPVAVDAPPPAIAGGHWEWKGKSLAGQRAEFLAMCPYGQPGDRLWVREAWAADAQLDWVAPRELSPGEPIRYQADGALRQTGCAMITQGKKRPAMFMPRWASRILLEITDVRVERLQAISEEQAKAECLRWHSLYKQWGGVESHPASRPECPQWRWYENPITAFSQLWESIHGTGSWDANPMVWAISFKRIQP